MENRKYLASINGALVIKCDEIIGAGAKLNDKETKPVLKNIICEIQSFYILLAFVLITIALFIAVGISCYL